MNRKTGLFLTLAAFGFVSDAQHVLAQQNLSLNQLGARRVESGLVTYNRFVPANPVKASSTQTLNASISSAVSRNAVQADSSPATEVPAELQLTDSRSSSGHAAAGSTQSHAGSQMYARPTQTQTTTGQAYQVESSQRRSYQPAIELEYSEAPSQESNAGLSNAGSVVSASRFTPVSGNQSGSVSNQSHHSQGNYSQSTFEQTNVINNHYVSGGNPATPEVQAVRVDSSLSLGANCDSPVACDSPLSVGDPNCDSSIYQQAYRTTRPTDYDASRSMSSRPSIYQQVAEQFQKSDLQIEDCDSCASPRPIYFGNVSVLMGLPYYSDTQPGIASTAGGLSLTEPFDYDTVFASRMTFGFETSKGPGGLIEYYNLSANSNLLTMYEPTPTTMVAAGLEPPFASPILISTPTGGRLEANAQQDLSSWRVEAFKRIYWPISTLSGGLGLDYMNFDQRVNYSNYLTPTATVANMTMNGQRRFEGVGPTFSMQYNRPIGHTHLSAIGGIRAGVIFGSDDWSVLSDGARVYETHGHRVVSTLNVNAGVEYSKMLGDCGNRRLFVRSTIEGQNWLNMGSFASDNADFGLLSLNLGVGLDF